MRAFVIGVDPGSAKAGFAVVGEGGEVVVAGVVAVSELMARLAALVGEYRDAVLAVGGGTNARRVMAGVSELGAPLYEVDEYETTRWARALYFREHPPTGWRRLIPVGLQVPPRPIDDYAAILIARRFLAEGGKGKTSKLKPPS